MVYRYLQRRLSSLIIATACTLVLGVVSALSFALVGPALQILTEPASADQSLSLARLLGDRLGAFAAWLLKQDSFPTSELWQKLPLLIVCTACLRAGLSLIQWFLWERASELVARDMRQDLVEAFLDLHPESRREAMAQVDAELAAHIGSDIRMVREYLVHFFGGFPRELVQVVFYLITLFLLEPSLASFFLLGLGPSALLLSRLGRKLRKRSQAVLNNVSQLSEWLQQRLSGIETIKQFRTEKTELAYMERLSAGLFKDFVRAARIKARTSPLLETVAAAAMMLVLGYAINEIELGKLNSSVLLSFFSVLAILSQSAAKLGRYFNSNKEGAAALRRFEDSMKIMQSGASLTWQAVFDRNQLSALELNQVSYTYPETREPALDNFCFSFSRARIYAIAGPSGSGKSTLLKLILGLWRAQTGELSYGVSGPRDIGYLPQSIQLMTASVAANIAYPEVSWDSDRILLALKQVQILDFVLKMPEGIDTQVGEGANSLSGGQAQRLQLARMFYHRFPLVVIDEGTSALDPETEGLIFSILIQMAAAGSTVVMVAHRLSALSIADELLVLRRGRLFYQGIPQTALQEDNWRDLFDGA
ncbi:MAG: ABC transporter ATP-binding protein [Proteobacteria bacterium]|nr:ABC transporter ATP-binding protein [Pseudomonadota bacterium]